MCSQGSCSHREELHLLRNTPNGIVRDTWTLKLVNIPMRYRMYLVTLLSRHTYWVDNRFRGTQAKFSDVFEVYSFIFGRPTHPLARVCLRGLLVHLSTTDSPTCEECSLIDISPDVPTFYLAYRLTDPEFSDVPTYAPFESTD